MKQDNITRSSEDWLELIEEWQQSNMSAKAWCQQREGGRACIRH